MFRMVLALIVWCVAASGATAEPEAASGMTMAEVAAVFERSGLPVEIAGDSAGEPVIFSQTNGLNFGLYQYGCGENGRCNEFLFSSVLELDTPLSLEQVNDYNKNAAAGRAFIDDQGGANVEHLFSVSGPEDADLVERNLMIWDGVLTDFAVFTGYWSAGS